MCVCVFFFCLFPASSSGPTREHMKILYYKIHLGILPVCIIAMTVLYCTVLLYSFWMQAVFQIFICNKMSKPKFSNLSVTYFIIQDDSKLLSGFPWPIIFKPYMPRKVHIEVV
jgi:hypothetical protein